MSVLKLQANLISSTFVTSKRFILEIIIILCFNISLIYFFIDAWYYDIQQVDWLGDGTVTTSWTTFLAVALCLSAFVLHMAVTDHEVSWRVYFSLSLGVLIFLIVISTLIYCFTKFIMLEQINDRIFSNVLASIYWISLPVITLILSKTSQFSHLKWYSIVKSSLVPLLIFLLLLNKVAVGTNDVIYLTFIAILPTSVKECFSGDIVKFMELFDIKMLIIVVLLFLMMAVTIKVVYGTIFTKAMYQTATEITKKSARGIGHVLLAVATGVAADQIRQTATPQTPANVEQIIELIKSLPPDTVIIRGKAISSSGSADITMATTQEAISNGALDPRKLSQGILSNPKTAAGTPTATLEEVLPSSVLTNGQLDARHISSAYMNKYRLPNGALTPSIPDIFPNSHPLVPSAPGTFVHQSAAEASITKWKSASSGPSIISNIRPNCGPGSLASLNRK